MDSDDEIQQQPVEGQDKPKQKGTYRTKAIKAAEAVLPRQKKVPTQKQLDALNANRSKALEKLTEMRREKAKVKEEAKKEMDEVKKIVEEKKLDAAPKVREIDTSMAVMKAEMEALKKELAESKKVVEPKRKVKKVVYEDEEDEEEIIEVVRKKVPAKAKSITGTELLDKLFFNQ